MDMAKDQDKDDMGQDNKAMFLMVVHNEDISVHRMDRVVATAMDKSNSPQ